MKIFKSVRNIRCFVLSLIIMATMIGSVLANAASTAEIAFGNVSCSAGEEVVVPVNIKNNPGISTFRFRVSYDTENLEFVSVTAGDVLTTGTLTSSADPDSKTMTFLWFSTTNVSGDGEIALLKFKVSEQAIGSYPLQITYLPQDLLNQDGDKIPYNVTDGLISTGSVVSGNITCFGNTTDAVTVNLKKDGSVIATISSVDNTYSFSSVAPGTYTIEVSKVNHVTRTYEVVVADEDISQDAKIHLKGDINGDGKANAVDKRLIYNHMNDSSKLLTGYEFDVANINGDTKVNAVDKRLIYNHMNDSSKALW